MLNLAEIVKRVQKLFGSKEMGTECSCVFVRDQDENAARGKDSFLKR